MKIIGSSRDYYDSALRHGHSTALYFVRKTEVFASRQGGDAAIAERAFLFEGMPGIRDSGNKKTGRVVLMPFRVAFCGKLYAGVEAESWGSERLHYGVEPTKREFFYDADALVQFLHETGARGVDAERSLSGNEFGTAAEAFLRSPQRDYLNFFVERIEAVAVARVQSYGEKTVTVNAMLKDVGFFKALDAWQAFQELEMFLGGIAAPENRPPVVIADKDRIAQRGFDRFSFRRAPTKRRAA
jgi:hypothetical protein